VRQDYEVETFITHQVSETLTSNGDAHSGFPEAAGLVAHSLRAEGFDASEDGTGRGTPLVPVSYGLSTQQEPKWADDLSPTLTVPSKSGGGQPTAVAFQPRFARNGRGAPDVVAAPLTVEAGRTGKGDSAQCVAFDTTQITSKANYSNPKAGDPCHPLAAGAHPPAIATGWAVRRLMPIECERLMGFPDGYTDIAYRGKPAADGPRYKALGNSWAVNVFRWVGRRIEMVEQISMELEKGRAA
jgi:DNA (cytosine-5)-methyltransferase 1